ncbi:MAG: hypothetical protein B6I34_04385 [Anaerolineaceae bacterium 4572_32.1]|nr:MAG: hypothetical protein B6I34_04385 [Anaerolineaceae bacterium 4572_32.1]
MEQLLVLEALAEIGDLTIVSEVSKLAGKSRSNLLPISASYVQTLVRLNQPDLAMKYFKPMIKPSKDDKHGTNLQFVLQAAKICGVEAVSPLCKNIMKEKRRWDPGR